MNVPSLHITLTPAARPIGKSEIAYVCAIVLPSNVTVTKWDYSNAVAEKVSTEDGMTMLEREVQLLNAYPLMHVTLLGIVTAESLSHPSKASLYISATVFPMSTVYMSDMLGIVPYSSVPDMLPVHG